MKLSDKFICAQESYSTFSKRVPAPIFRKNITVSGDFQKAEITVCGLGFYELYLNGKNITKGRLSPYITNSEQVMYYDNYDITEYLKNENCFEFILGNGMQNCFGGFVWDFEKVEFRSSPKLAFAVEITYSNGKTDIIEADQTVEASESNILSDDLRLGEIYDANKNNREWKFAVRTRTPKGEKVLSSVKPIVTREELKPVKIFKEDNSFIYDFGINTSGVCRISVEASKCQEIKLTFCEILKNGRFSIDTTTFDNVKDKYFQQDIYICKDGFNEWTPTFTYHGFRYVKVEGVTEEQATENLLTFVVFNTDLGEIGEFVCDNNTINSLHKMSLNSTLSNFHHFPTDCPHREKNGWTADAALSASHTLLYFEPTDNYKQWLVSICKSQNDDGAIPGIIPTWGWGFEWGNGPAWDSVLSELPYQIWQKRNDLSAFEICKDSLVKYIKYLETRKNDKGLIEIGLGDWCAPDNPRKAPLILTDSIEFYDIACKSAQMFIATGDMKNAEFCTEFAKNMRDKIREHLFDTDTCIFAGNSQTSQAMGIYYGIINENEKSKALNALIEIIKLDDYHIATGVLGGRVLFHLLAENGEIDTAMKIITNPTSPSYNQWVLAGETALCEGFGEYNGLSSRNHHFWGNVSAFFMEQICGIKVCANEINIEPHFPICINKARASFNSVFGKVSVFWKRENGKIRFELEYPENANGIFKYENYTCPANQVNETLYF